MTTEDNTIDNVKQWLQQSFDKPLAEFYIHSISHLSTPHYTFFLIQQKEIHGAGDMYVMSDGAQTLLADKEHFSQILEREGYLENTSIIPPHQLAELYLRMAEGRSGGILTDKDDILPDNVELSNFSPPHIKQTNDGVILRFWITGHSPFDVSRWTVHIEDDYQVSGEETVLHS